MFAIISRELRSLFVSPLAWTLLATVQFILAWLFLQQLETFDAAQQRFSGLENTPGLTDLVSAPLFAGAGMLLVFIIPLLTMRSLAEEYRSGSIQLLMSAPISSASLIGGKFLALLIFILISEILTAAMPLSLLVGGSLDFGKFLAGFLGLILLSSTAIAAGIMMSSFTRHPAVAAISSYGLLLFMWVAGNNVSKEGETNLMRELSFAPHFDRILNGSIDSSDLLFFIVLSGLCLILARRRVEDGYQG